MNYNPFISIYYETDKVWKESAQSHSCGCSSAGNDYRRNYDADRQDHLVDKRQQGVQCAIYSSNNARMFCNYGACNFQRI